MQLCMVRKEKKKRGIANFAKINDCMGAMLSCAGSWKPVHCKITYGLICTHQAPYQQGVMMAKYCRDVQEPMGPMEQSFPVTHAAAPLVITGVTYSGVGPKPHITPHLNVKQVYVRTAPLLRIASVDFPQPWPPLPCSHQPSAQSSPARGFRWGIGQSCSSYYNEAVHSVQKPDTRIGNSTRSKDATRGSWPYY